MGLSSSVITQNYYAGYQLALDLIRQKRALSGFNLSAVDTDMIELAQSVFGCERLVRLIQTTPFRKDLYENVIAEELERISKTLFPDVGKKRFVSLEKLHDSYDYEFPDGEAPPDEPACDAASAIQYAEILDYVKNKLSQENFDYLSELFSHQNAKDREFAWNDNIYRLIDQSLDYLEEKISEMRRLFPDGRPYPQEAIDVKKPMTDAAIIGCYKNVYLGIYNRFPVNFLSHEGPRRAAVMTRYAVETVLKKPPIEVLKSFKTRELASIGLTGVVRLFNYSVARVIRNAYPELLMPWESGHVDEGFWNDETNRRMAIQWLVETKMKIARAEIPKALRENQISKATFIDHGLSYLYNQHYKSVSRALQFAYPELMPWELGSVPNSFWKGPEGRQNVIQAIHWMIRQLQIPVTEIPVAIRNKVITRETFKSYGLSTVYESLFKKNMYQLFNTAYPGQFEIWEIGKTPAEYWDNVINGYRAALWVARKENVEEKKISRAIRTGKLSRETFARYGLSAMLKRTFDNELKNAYLPYLVEYNQDLDMLLRDALLLSVLQLQMQKIKSQTIMHRLFKGLFFRALTGTAERSQLRLYDRIKKRIKSRMGDLSRRIMTDY